MGLPDTQTMLHFGSNVSLLTFDSHGQRLGEMDAKEMRGSEIGSTAKGQFSSIGPMVKSGDASHRDCVYHVGAGLRIRRDTQHREECEWRTTSCGWDLCLLRPAAVIEAARCYGSRSLKWCLY